MITVAENFLMYGNGNFLFAPSGHNAGKRKIGIFYPVGAKLF
jgi:hypothetical protein